MRLILLLMSAFWLSACATTKFQVLEINSLASKASGDGQFDGLEGLANRGGLGTTEREIERINILFLHGVGSIENPEDAPLGQ